jgi:1,2-diacylglycerol 3-beta-glucosyltransferase
MIILQLILAVISTILFVYLFCSVLYLLFFAVLGKFRKKENYTSYPDKYSIAVLIPAYREDAVICDTVQHILRQQYPRDRFEVVVIADSLAPSTMDQLRLQPITIIPLTAVKSTKAKALTEAMVRLPQGKFEIALVLDADNVMEPDALEKVNHAFHSGVSVGQMHRTAKNRNTPVSVLEGTSEEINNHIFRKGHRAAGFTSALIGSGMVFQYPYFRELMLENKLEDISGYEDREIEMILIRDRRIVEYLDNITVFDEKVPNAGVLERQRTKWVSGQLNYLRKFMVTDAKKLLEFRMNYWDKVIQTALLPRVLLLGLLAITGALAVLCHFCKLQFPPGNRLWAGLFALYIFILAISIPPAMYDRKFLGAIRMLPATGWALLKALFKARTGPTHFMQTPKDYPPSDTHN